MKTETALAGLALAFALGAAAPAFAQDAPPLDAITSQAELDKAITALDAALFGAYNHCDLAKFKSLLADDVEFYHDQGGVTLGAQALTDSIRTNICGGDVVRELAPGSLKVYYMKGYGAVEIGTHRFLHPQSHTPTGEGQFITLWRWKDGAWKITRAISFDHKRAD